MSHRGTAWLVGTVAAAMLLSVCACGGTVAGAGPGHAASTMPRSPSRAPGNASPSGVAATGGSVCGLLSAGDAAAALGRPVGKARPAPGVGLANGAVGSTCEWADSARGVVGVAVLTYPSASIASRLFSTSKGGGGNIGDTQRAVRLPAGLAPGEFGYTNVFEGTRTTEAALLDGNRELSVTVSEPASGLGSPFNLAAFVTLVRQAARAWR